MWCDFFNKTFLINLPERRDRYWISTWELTRYNIPYEVIRATKNQDGREGLYQTMRQMFERSVQAGYKRILVFEDDVRLVTDPGPVMEKVIPQLPDNWDLLYLGCNLATRPTKFYSPNLLPVTRALSTHAVGYSRACMERILSLPKLLPIDNLFCQTIQAAGKSFCVCPFLVSQYAGYSDIEKRDTDWSNVLDKRFAEQVSPLIQQCNYENIACCRA